MPTADAATNARATSGAPRRKPAAAPSPGERVVLGVRDLPGRQREAVREVVHRRHLDHVPRVLVGEAVAAEVVEVTLLALDRATGDLLGERADRPLALGQALGAAPVER